MANAPSILDPNFKFMPAGGKLDQRKRNAMVIQNETDLFQLLLPWARQQIEGATGLEGDKQMAIRQILEMMSPENSRLMADRDRTRIMNRAGSEGLTNAAMSRAFGGSASAQRGEVLASRNRGVSEAYQRDLDTTSPEALMQQALMRSQISQSGQDTSSLNPLMALGANVYGKRTTVPKDPNSGLGGLLGAVGSAVGGGWNPFAALMQPKKPNVDWMGNIGRFA